MGEEPGLHLFCNFQLLGGAAFGFQLLGSRAALRFDLPAHLVEAHQRKRISIDVSKAREHSSPNRRRLSGRYRRVRRTPGRNPHLILEAFQARRILKANPALPPFLELGHDVFGDKSNVCGPSNQLVLFRVGLGRHQRQVRSAFGRGNGYPAASGLKAGIKGQIEPKLLHVEPRASVQIANVDGNRLNAEVGVMPIQASRGLVRPVRTGG